MLKFKENVRNNSLYVGLFVIISIILLGIGIGSTDGHFFIRNAASVVLGILFAPVGIIACLFLDFNQSFVGIIRGRRTVVS